MFGASFEGEAEVWLKELGGLKGLQGLEEGPFRWSVSPYLPHSRSGAAEVAGGSISGRHLAFFGLGLGSAFCVERVWMLGVGHEALEILVARIWPVSVDSWDID